MRRHLRNAVLSMIAGAMFVGTATAADDNASNAAYTGGLTNGSNGGTGFQPWILNPPTNGSSGFFVFNSNNNGSNAGPGINTGSNVAWGFYANSGNNAIATRPFTAPIAVGETFGLRMDNGFIDGGASVGFRLADSSDNVRFAFQFVGGASNYTITDGSGTVTTTLPYTDGGLNVAVDMVSSTQYLVTATRLADNATYQALGTLAAGATIDRFIAFNNNAGNGSTNDAYFNSASITPVPEPVSMLALCGAATIGAVGYRRFRKA